ncbi:MAG TPA: hypothetical protein VF284_02775 [Rhodanobacteraceae bacterium]
MPQQPAANDEGQRDQQQLGPRYPLRTALAVVPREDHRHHEAQHQQAEHDVHRGIRPVVAVGHHIQYLDQCERERHIGHGPLHQLALLQALQEVVHRYPFARCARLAISRDRTPIDSNPV